MRKHIEKIIKNIPFKGDDVEVIFDPNEYGIKETLIYTPVQRYWDVQYVPDGSPQIALDYTAGSAAAVLVRFIRYIRTAKHSRPGTIYVNASLTETQQIHALLHELGHMYTDDLSWEGLYTWEYAAEQFALAILSRLSINVGLSQHDVNNYSFSARGSSKKVNRREANKAVKAALKKFEEEFKNVE